MIRINLLPREERVRKRSLPALKLPAVGAAVPFLILGAVVGAIGVVGSIQGREVARLEAEVAALRQESESYTPQLEKIRQITQKRQEVGNRLDLIARLDRERYFRVRLLDQLSRAVPENLWLTRVQEGSGRKFTIEGVTFSNIIVARFLQDLESTLAFEGVELGVAQKGTIEDFDVVQFTLVTGAQP